MLTPFAENPVVNDVIARASRVLGQDLGRLIAEGPADELSLTTNTQPCMFVAGFAVYAAWRSAGGSMPGVVAGHSLGEYTALAAAEALTLEDAVPLLRFRAQAMQEAVAVGAGSMAAILGLTDDAVRQACAEAALDEVVEAVNFNAPSQVVIAGHRAAVQRACEVAKRLGAKRAVPLAVSAPFHSSLMAPAGERLRERLAAVPIARPTTAVINNVDVAVETEPDRIRDALVRQAARPVRWSETIAAMAADGVTHIVECGPGRVLAGLTRRIAPEVESSAITDPQSMKDVAVKLGAAA